MQPAYTPSLFYTLLLSLLPGAGASRHCRWVEACGSAEQVLLSAPAKLPGISAEAHQQLLEFQRQGETSTLATKGHEVLAALEKHNACLLDMAHPDYPALLKHIHRPPPLLYAKGNTQLLSLPQIAVIGSRHPTNAGIENTRAFSQYLSAGGFVITSGLAIGIDSAAHKAALDSQGPTIAVMATGIDRIYPQRNQALATKILERGGLLITEFAPGTAAHATHFPQRNRLISGISMGVLVIEAAIKSGSLITARYAIEQNREVFAVPSSIHNPQSRGCHTLIKQGAHLVETGADVVTPLRTLIGHVVSEAVNTPQYTASDQQTVPQHPLDAIESVVFEQIHHEAAVIEHIIERTGLSSAEVTTALLNLELKGMIKHSHWGYEVIRQAV